MSNCFYKALNSVKPEKAGTASALGGFIHFGWGAILTIILASIEQNSSFVFSVAQLFTTALAFTTIILLVPLFNQNK